MKQMKNRVCCDALCCDWRHVSTSQGIYELGLALGPRTTSLDRGQQ